MSIARRLLLAGAVVTPPGVMSFVAAAGANYIASGTSISSPAIPAGVMDLDGIFAVLFARSALTPPAGWTLVASQVLVPLGANQTLYVYRKNDVTAADASTSPSWSQAASGRMGLAYLVCRSSSSALVVPESSGDTTSTGSQTLHTVDVPVLTAAAPNELFLVAATCIVGSDTASANTWTPTSGATLRTIATQAANRLMFATQSRSAGQQNAATCTFDLAPATASANEFGTIAVRLRSS